MPVNNIEFRRHRVAVHRRHYVTEEDLRVVLSRLPEELYVRLKRVLLKDDARGRDVLGYTTRRGRREVSICALPVRVSLSQICTKFGLSPETFGALRGSQWPTLAVRRFLLYDTFLHELGHLQIILPKAKNINRKFASEGKAEAFAHEWRGTLWSQPFDHPDPAHNPPGEDELKALKAGWREAHLSYKRGLRLKQERNYEAAAQHFRRAVELYPKHALALEALGIMTYRGFDEQSGTGDTRLLEAESLLRWAVELDPALPEAHLCLAQTLEALDETREAQSMFLRAIELDPYEGLATVIYADAHLGHRSSDEASRLFEKVLRKDPENPFALRYYARHCLRMADQDDEDAINHAIDLLRRSQDVDPNNPFTHFTLGLALSRLDGQQTEAVQHLHECLRLRPGHKKASALLEHLGNPPLTYSP